jgi:hypothetical protein
MTNRISTLSCNQVLALIRLLERAGCDYFHKEFCTATDMLTGICSLLNSDDIREFTSVARSTAIEGFDISPYVDTELEINFSDVIGCYRAKELLEENIVLQMKLPTDVRDQLFQGLYDYLSWDYSWNNNSNLLYRHS